MRNEEERNGIVNKQENTVIRIEVTVTWKYYVG